jgi:CRISPR type IV-associated protein Csf2
MEAQTQPETKNYRYEGTVTALSSICHGGETKSTTQVLRREKVVTLDGSVVSIPIYSGNALRGILRDCGMRFMLRCLGNPPMSVGALHFLFSGGSLTGKPMAGEKGAKRLGTSTSSVPIGDARDLMKVIPLVGIFGGACGSMIMEGKLQVGKAVPICREAERLIPAKFLPSSTLTIWEYLQTESYTRRDDSKREEMRQLLGKEDRLLLDSAHTKARQQTVTEQPDQDVGQHQQMRYHVQTFAAGTRFYWWLSLRGATELEFEAMASCLVEFLQYPTIGGKGAAGHGQIEIKLDGWSEISPAAVQADAIGKPLGQTYADHLVANKQEIVDLLGRI